MKDVLLVVCNWLLCGNVQCCVVTNAERVLSDNWLLHVLVERKNCVSHSLVRIATL